ncbi:MAG: A/G-specific adenine glycosylase [Deltaproteobacteria bacterium]|jgi:A/G-specific adenine glycosylase
MPSHAVNESMTFRPADSTSFQRALLRWYHAHHRNLPWRSSRDPYHIWVSEVMLQQTQVNTVLPYFALFVERFPTLEALAGADLQEVLKTWEGLGYYARARNLHRAAQVVIEEMDGKIPESWTEFKTLPGVGNYIASAVQSIAFDHAHAVVDGNVKRVLARVFLMKSPVNHAASQRVFEETAGALMTHEKPGTYNQAIMELGALICKPRNPECKMCCLSQLCGAFRTGRADKYPKRNKRKRVPTHRVATGVVWRNGTLLITRRKPDGLLGGLWEFPGGKVDKGEDPRDACIREIREETGIRIRVCGHMAFIKHAYTHFKIEMDVFQCEYESGKIRLNGPDAFRWIRLDEIQQYPFPKANLKFIPLIEKI